MINKPDRKKLASMLPVFFAALMFYTRIPCPENTPHDRASLNRATLFFPMIGWIIGLIAALVFLVGQAFVSTFSALLLSTLAGILATGAFHEDGFADACDGFGGGWDKRRILDIMKDSRIGVYGALGLAGILTLKLSLLHDWFSSVPASGFILTCLFFVNAHTLSRLMATACVYFGHYARENDKVGAKAKPLATSLSKTDFQIACGLAAMPLLLWFLCGGTWSILLSVLVMAVVTWRMLNYFDKWIGGYTGDCLGAVQQLTEVCFYLVSVFVFALLH